MEWSRSQSRKNVGAHGKHLSLEIRNTHVKYQSFNTHCPKVIIKVKVSDKL